MIYMRAPRCLFLPRDERANLHPRRTGELVSELYKLTTVMEQLFDGEPSHSLACCTPGSMIANGDRRGASGDSFTNSGSSGAVTATQIARSFIACLHWAMFP